MHIPKFVMLMQLTRDLKINLKTSISNNGDTVNIIKVELYVLLQSSISSKPKKPYVVEWERQTLMITSTASTDSQQQAI